MKLDASLNLRTEIEDFALQNDVQHALFLTYNFDGGFLEDAERGLLEVLWRRNCENVLVVRDGKAVLAEKRAHRYSVINAAYSKRTFHPKLVLLLSPSEMLAVIGSANLTRGGLERNLELAGVYHLTKASGPLSLFGALYDYLHDCLRRELAAASPQQLDAFDILVRDFDRFLDDARLARSSVEPLFLHNYGQPLLPQIAQALPSKRLDALWIVSPFFEPDPVHHQSSNSSPEASDIVPSRSTAKYAIRGNDPPSDRLDETLLEEIFRTFIFVTKNQRSPVRIYFQASTANTTRLPLNILRRFKSQIALYAKNIAGIDQRALHAKMLVFVGRHPTNEPFVTVVHGSANFTRAALLSTPPNGNAEIVVVTQLPYTNNLAKKLDDYLNLGDLFTEIHNWNDLTYQDSPLPVFSPRGVQVWEGLVSLVAQTVTVFFQVDHPDVQRVTVTLRGDQCELFLGEIIVPFPNNQEFSLPEAAIITVNLEMGLRQLPYHCIRVEAFDVNGQLLDWGEGALNVDCPGSFCGDWQPDQLWLDTLDTRIYLAGLGSTTGYTALRTHVERVLSTTLSARSDVAPVPSHQADLDIFFRRLHIGFRGLRHQLEHRSSLYVFGNVLRQLAGWAQAAVQDEEQYTTERRLYLCECTVQTVLECVDVMKRASHTPEVLASIVRDEFLSGAGPIRGYVDELCRDENVGMAARNLLKQWDMLEFGEEEVGR